jgi:hypothetical protein
VRIAVALQVAGDLTLPPPPEREPKPKPRPRPRPKRSYIRSAVQEATAKRRRGAVAVAAAAVAAAPPSVPPPPAPPPAPPPTVPPAYRKEQAELMRQILELTPAQVAKLSDTNLALYDKLTQQVGSDRRGEWWRGGGGGGRGAP